MFVSPTQARATRLLYIEICWSSILGGVVTFNAAYLLRLGGTSLDVSLLGAMPALVTMLLSVPAGHFLQTRAHPIAWTLVCLGGYWTGWLAFAFIPWIHLGGLAPGSLATLIVLLASLPAQIFNVGIYVLLTDVIAEPQRVHAFAVRSIINACIGSAVTFLAGQWLTRAAFPGNYQLMYVVAWFCGLMSITCLALASRLLQRAPAAAPAPAIPAVLAAPPRKMWPDDLARQPDFVHFAINSLLHNLPLWMATPLYVVFFVRTLGASDAWLGLYGTATGISTIVGLFFWRWITVRLGQARAARLSVMCVGVMPLLVGLLPNLNAILAISALNGFFMGGIVVSHINVLLNAIPKDRQPQFMGLWAATQNAGAFICPLVSVALSARWGIVPTLLFCGLLGLFGAAAHWVWRVPGPRPSPKPLARPEIEGA